MMHQGWQEVQIYPPGVGTVFPALFFQMLPNLTQAFLFRFVDKWRFDLTNRKVFEEAERSAGGSQAVDALPDLFDQGDGEIVEGQPADEVLIDAGTGQFLDRGVEQPERSGRTVKRALDCLRKTLAEHIDEVGIDFNDVELVAWLQVMQDLGGDRTGACANLKDAGRWSVAFQTGSEFTSEESAARHDGTGMEEILSEGLPHQSAFLEKTDLTHRGAPGAIVDNVWRTMEWRGPLLATKTVSLSG